MAGVRWRSNGALGRIFAQQWDTKAYFLNKPRVPVLPVPPGGGGTRRVSAGHYSPRLLRQLATVELANLRELAF